MRAFMVLTAAAFAIVHTTNGAHGFAPENDEELSSLRELEDAHLRVVLYLASRRFVEPAAEHRTEYPADRIRGPLAITPGPSGVTPPAASMRNEGRTAFQLFERNDPQHEFQIGPWMILARPVRAINATCLRCHSSNDTHWPTNNSDLRVGDVLGVLFYGYRPAIGSQ